MGAGASCESVPPEQLDNDGRKLSAKEAAKVPNLVLLRRVLYIKAFNAKGPDTTIEDLFSTYKRTNSDGETVLRRDDIMRAIDHTGPWFEDLLRAYAPPQPPGAAHDAPEEVCFDCLVNFVLTGSVLPSSRCTDSAACFGAAAARGLRGAVANAEAEEFFRNLMGFLDTRDKLDEATLGFMPTKGADVFKDVGDGDMVLSQDLGDTAADMDAQLDALYDRADAAKKLLDAFCRRLFTDAGLDPDKEMIRETRKDEEDKVFRAVSEGRLKTRERATEKVTNEYDGDAARLVDVVRGSIVCGDEASLVAVLKRVLEDFSDEAGDVFVVRSKNRFLFPLFNGYRDVLINLRLRLPDGTSMVVELQVHLVQILQFKGKTHVYYEYFRTYFCGNLVVVAERMKVLESIAGADATAGLADAVDRAVKAQDASKLEALDDLLEKLAAYDLLALVRKCRRDMALAEHGEDSVEYSFALNKLAGLLKAQGKLAAAEPLYRRALEIREKLLGLEHLDVATSLNNLASLLEKRRKLDDAEPLYRRALEIKEKLLRPNHASVATSLGNLARLLKAQNKLDAAEPLFFRALKIKEKELGPDHPGISALLGNLAGMLKAQDKFDAAEPLYLRSIAIKEKQLGRDHPDVATTLGNLAGMLEDQKKLDAAEPLYLRVLEIRERQLGRDQPGVVTSLNNLAGLLKAQGKLEDAEPLYRRALAIKEKLLGPDHKNVAISLNNLAKLLKAQDTGKLDAAEPLYRRVIAIKEKQLGPDHPDVVTLLNNLAGMLEKQEELDAAEPLYRRVIEIKEKQLGPDHSGVSASLNNLAELLKKQGKLDATEPLYRRVLEIREKKLGSDSPNIAISLNNLALLMWRLGRLDAALPLQERATSIRERRGDAKEAKYRRDLKKMRRGAKYPYKQ